MPNGSGVWSLSQQFQARGQGLWPQLPGAPTIGTATAGTTLCASVAFTAPTCAGYPTALTYTVTSTPGCKTATGAASPLTVTGLSCGTSYTFKVKATNASGVGPCSAASNSITAKNATCATYTTAGTYSWVVPTGVTSVAAVAIGAGGGARGGTSCRSGGGGGLAYVNGISVTPGETLTVTVGAGGVGSNGTGSTTDGGNSTLKRGCTTLVGAGGGKGTPGGYVGGAPIVGTGGTGGTGAFKYGGGGAGGYSGNGGAGSDFNANGAAGAGGGGGGGGSLWVVSAPCSTTLYSGSGGGGGTGIYGAGSSGAGGCKGYACSPSYIVVGGAGGGGGSASTGTGTNGTAGGLQWFPSIMYNGNGGAGGLFGGGGGTGGQSSNSCGNFFNGTGGTGGRGAVRIVWAGGSRGAPSFPSTNVGP